MHPLRCEAIASARLKNDKVDAAILGQLLRAGLLPEAWIAPPAIRQLRALLRPVRRHQAIATRRGKKIATTAVARKLLTRAWHLLTDAERAAAVQPAQAAAAARAGTR